jgi:hypothetical protein
MTKKTYNSWNGDQELKNQVVALIKLDKTQERIVKGSYWDLKEQKGCCIGCGEYAVCQATNDTFQNKKHEYLQEKLNVPASVFYLADSIFEGLPDYEANQFVVDFWVALPVGKDLTRISSLMQIKSLQICRENAFNDGKAIIDLVISLKNRELGGEVIGEEEWSTARSAAESAESAARSAAEYAAGSAAESAEYAAGSAAESAWAAAESVARSVAEYAAESVEDDEAAYQAMRDYFLQLLIEA